MTFFALFFGELALLFISSHFLIRSLSLLFYKITHSQKITIYLLALLFLPGVIIHELSHFLMASMLFVRAGDIEFMPKLEHGGVKLGSVQIEKTDPFRRALIGFAPFLFGVSLLIGLLLYVYSNSFLDQFPLWSRLLLIGFVVFELANTMFSSKKDLEGTLELLVTLGALGIILFIIGLRPQQFLSDFFMSDQAQAIIKQICVALFVPILVNGVVYVFTKAVLRR